MVFISNSAPSKPFSETLDSNPSDHITPTILITGASQGCGKATALLFAKKGYNVVLSARQEDRLKEVANEIRSLGRSALALPTDVSDRQQVEELISKALDSFGYIDVLVNNAGVYLSGTLEETTQSDLQWLINTNFWGYVYTIKALLPHFMKRESGTIVNMIGLAGKISYPQASAYCASKHAVKGMTDSLRLDLEPLGIQVCGIYPNWIGSDLMERAVFRGNNKQDIRERCTKMNNNLNSPLASTPEDIAKVIWDAVKKKRAEVIVGSAVAATEANRLFPKLTNWILRKSAS